MKPVMTKKGVLIDVCPSCHGVWLDQGEINFFLKDWSILKKYLHFGLDKARSLSIKCPKCHEGKIQTGQFPGLSDVVERCSNCQGLYFDAHEFKKLQKNENLSELQEDTSLKVSENRTSNIKVSLPKLPSLAFTTCLVGGSLYALLFGVIVFLMELENIPLSLYWANLIVIGFIAFEFYFGPIFLDWQLRLLGSLNWVSINELPKHFKRSLFQICQTHNLPLPKIGIILDNAPQAYTYGRTPYSARLVFSQGLFELLDQDEIETVLAHEMGHVKHWDFVVMTAIKVVPIMLYNFYLFLIKKSDKNKSRSGGKTYAALIAYIAYLCADYLVLFVSRLREYHADKFSCFATKKPNHLMKALIKISYGLLEQSTQKESQSSQDSKDKSPTSRRTHIEAFNIMGTSSSKQLALTQRSASKEGFNPEFIKEIMKWDLWNPWAFYYELNSSHPLTAKRINAIGSYALALNQKPYLVFDKKKPESYWDEFFLDIFILCLPYILGLVGLLSCSMFVDLEWIQIFKDFGRLAQEDGQIKALLPYIHPIATFVASGLLGCCIGAFIRTLKAYPGGLFSDNFFFCCVSALLKIIKVSPVRSYPVILRGQILGRGDPGQVLSEDFFFKDKTGLMFINHEPFGLNLWFGLVHFKKFQGKEVTVKGWYRRSPNPTIEVKTIQTFDYSSRAYTYYYKIGFASIGILVSLIILLLL